MKTPDIYNKCLSCGNKFPAQYNVCGECGHVYEIIKDFVSLYEFKTNNKKSEIQPEILMKKIKSLLEKESAIRMQIVSMNKKLFNLTTIKSNDTGYINIDANRSEVKISESSFRLIIQQDVNDLMFELNKSVSALEEFINKF